MLEAATLLEVVAAAAEHKAEQQQANVRDEARIPASEAREAKGPLAARYLGGSGECGRASVCKGLCSTSTQGVERCVSAVKFQFARRAAS